MSIENNTGWTVYVHVNKINNKRYVGITSLSTHNRWRNGEGYKNQVFGKAILKYGWDNFDHIVLFKNLSLTEANKIEQKLISCWDTCSPSHGYNIAAGGGGISGFHFTDESRKKMSESAKTRNICYETRRKHPPISETTRQKMSKNNTGVNNPNYGKKHSDAALKKMSDVHSKKVALLNSDGSIEREFKSAKIAAEYIGVEKSFVAKCCRGVLKSCKGRHFKYL